MQIIQRPEWNELVTFVPNKKIPVHNWFHYKEGFSRQLVFEILDEFAVTDGVILDPFCGVGTTLLACKERSIDAIGFDTSPLAVLASKAKTADYDTESLKQEAKMLLKHKFVRMDTSSAPAVMKRGFSKYVLEDVFFFRSFVSSIADEKTRNFFLLALIKAAINVSWTWKDGAVIKIRKRHVAPLRVMLKRSIYGMIKDLNRIHFKECSIRIEQTDARYMPLDNESVDCVITSPPYLNNIDYTKVYAIENFIAASAAGTAVRSFIDDVAYFNDMKLVINELQRVCKPGAKCAIVVGNAPGIECDVQLAELAQETGFVVSKIYNAKTRYELENRTTKKGMLRESVITLQKA